MMKTYKLLIYLLLIPLFNFGQESCFPLYFEDAIGNKDTVYFGEAPSATFGIDEQLGEANLLNQPIDTIFEVFFTDGASGNLYESGHDCHLTTDQTPCYISKKQFIGYPKLYDWYELGMIAKYWPVTISWNQKDIENYVAQKGCSYCNLFLYSWNPPVSLIGDVFCCGNWPNYYTLLNDTSSVIVDKSNLCHYAAPLISKDSVNLFFIKYSSFTKVLQTKIGGLSCWYNSNKNTIVFSAGSEIESCVVEVFDLNGRLLITETTDNDCSKNYEIEASALPKGSYIVVASSSENKSQIKTQKIQVQ
jgi:Secretion system C-terminal sorting domain